MILVKKVLPFDAKVAKKILKCYLMHINTTLHLTARILEGVTFHYVFSMLDGKKDRDVCFEKKTLQTFPTFRKVLEMHYFDRL